MQKSLEYPRGGGSSLIGNFSVFFMMAPLKRLISFGHVGILLGPFLSKYPWQGPFFLMLEEFMPNFSLKVYGPIKLCPKTSCVGGGLDSLALNNLFKKFSTSSRHFLYSSVQLSSSTAGLSLALFPIYSAS